MALDQPPEQQQRQQQRQQSHPLAGPTVAPQPVIKSIKLDPPNWACLLQQGQGTADGHWSCGLLALKPESAEGP
jgi:hypothetical protein